MTDSTEADGVDVQNLEHAAGMNDHRAKVALYDELKENEIDWDIEIESADLSEEQQEQLKAVVQYTIGGFRGIVGNDKYIESGVYWTYVKECAEDVKRIKDDDPDWADDDLDMFLEVVMPSAISRYYAADPVAHFFTLYHSKHDATGWLQDMGSEWIEWNNDAQELAENIDGDGWKGVLENMAYAACVQDVAQVVREDGYDVDLGHFEFREDLR